MLETCRFRAFSLDPNFMISMCICSLMLASRVRVSSSSGLAKSVTCANRREPPFHAVETATYIPRHEFNLKFGLHDAP